MNEENQNIALFIVFLLIISIFVSVIIWFHKPEKAPIEGASTFVLSPTPEGVFRPAASEPLVGAWKTYSNEVYAFTLNMPAEWNVQDYAKAHANGGTLVAFSPEKLPCATCSYFRNGYFSVRIYNEKTAADAYTLFTQRIQAVGKHADYHMVTLGGQTGVAFGNIAAVENRGWVYEFSLDRNDGKDKFTDSEIFLKVLSSFEFAQLLFNE